MFSLQKVHGYETQRDIKDFVQEEKKKNQKKLSLTFCLDARSLSSILTKRKS